MSREWPSPDTCLASALALASRPAGPWEGTLRRMSRPVRGCYSGEKRLRHRLAALQNQQLTRGIPGSLF